MTFNHSDPSRGRNLSIRIATTLTVVVSSLMLAACSASEGSVPDAVTVGSSDVEFTGPYSEVFAEEYTAERTSEIGRKILEDGKITEAELAEARDRLEQCMAGHGIELVSLEGRKMKYNVTVDDDSQEELVTECEFSSGVQPAYYLDLEVRGNPENIDDATVMVQCFLDRGVVPADYTADDYNRDNPEYAFPFAGTEAGERAYAECVEDPLGLIAQGNE